MFISNLCPDCQDLWERVHWVQRDQPQFWDAGHRESRAGGGLSQSLGGCEERPSKSARQLKLEDGCQQNFLLSRIVVFFGHVAHGTLEADWPFSQVWWFLLQPTGICSNLLSFHFGYFRPMCTLPKSAWICFYLHVISSVSDKYFALTVVTLFININVFYSLLFLVASFIWWYISILMQYFNYRSLEALWSQTSSWRPLGPLDPLIKGPLCPPCLLHWGRVNQAHLPSEKIGEYLTLSHIRWVSVGIRWSKKHWQRTNRF